MKRWLAVAAIGVVGTALLIAWFSRLDPYAGEPVTISRQEAIARAMQLSSRYGVTVAGWRTYVACEALERLHAYHMAYPDDKAARELTAVQWDIAFRPPAGKGSVRVVTRSSPNAVYDAELASFSASGGLFSQTASPGFIELWSLQSRMAHRIRRRGEEEGI